MRRGLSVALPAASIFEPGLGVMHNSQEISFRYMKEEDFRRIAREKAKAKKVDLSDHAADEAFDETITVQDIHQALSHERAQVLEPYLDDPRGPSCFFVGPAVDGRWIHVVVGGFDRERLVVITVYRPNPPKWKDPFTRGG